MIIFQLDFLETCVFFANISPHLPLTIASGEYIKTIMQAPFGIEESWSWQLLLFEHRQRVFI